MQGDRADVEVNKTGPRNVDLVDEFAGRQFAYDLSRNLTRIPAKRFGQAHSDIGRKITVARITRPFHGAADRGNDWRGRQFRQAVNCLRYKLCDAGFQEVGPGVKIV